MKSVKIGRVITSIRNLQTIETFGLDHCELGFIHPEESGMLFETLPDLSYNIGIHFPLIRFGDTIPPSTEYALLDFNETRSDFFFKKLENDARLARDMNAEYLLVHLQRFFRLFSEIFTMGEEKFWKLVIEKGKHLDQIREKYKIPIVLEAICGCDYLYSPEHYLKFILAFPEFGYCLDISHIQIDRWIYGISPTLFVESLKSKITHLHLNNFKIPEKNIPFTRYNFFKHYKKSAIDINHTESQGYAEIHKLLDTILNEKRCRYFVFEQHLPDLSHPDAQGILNVTKKIRDAH